MKLGALVVIISCTQLKKRGQQMSLSSFFFGGAGGVSTKGRDDGCEPSCTFVACNGENGHGRLLYRLSHAGTPHIAYVLIVTTVWLRSRCPLVVCPHMLLLVPILHLIVCARGTQYM